MPDAIGPDVYSASEIAAAAGTTEARVESLIARGEIRSVGALAGARRSWRRTSATPRRFAPCGRCGAGSTVALPDAAWTRTRAVLRSRVQEPVRRTMPFVVSTSLHAIVVATILIIASLGLASADEPTLPIENPDPIRLVFLAIPGPGGGGGGGGLKMPKPPPKAERKGPAKISSPLPARELPPPIRPMPKPPEPPEAARSQAASAGDGADRHQARRDTRRRRRDGQGAGGAAESGSW